MSKRIDYRTNYQLSINYQSMLNAQCSVVSFTAVFEIKEIKTLVFINMPKRIDYRTNYIKIGVKP
ncbi:MAG: hypothetical protein DRR16_04000 [Candidatus Parabeggiatoa sp. nov. 3]|jgi:hypothetical protein|nr:MAG: hypothetical protein DRR00_16525 [Gammaproteobacteria bacterium]RKZ88874.1 MAG: hypothetical protein DRR16_04000 [Gammaproteobacteria bacterium]